MWSLIWKWIGDNYPALLIIAVIAWLSWKARGIFHRFEKTEAECKKIEDTVAPRLTSIDKTLNSIDKSFHALITFLATKHTDFNVNLYKSNSPMQLTDLGNEILNAIGGKKYIDDNAASLIQKLSKETIKSALDVENYAKVILIQEYNSDAFTAIKNYIYQNPVYKKDALNVSLDVATISNIMGLYLRDKYFEIHPELINAGS